MKAFRYVLCIFIILRGYVSPQQHPTTPFLIQSALSTTHKKWCIGPNNGNLFPGKLILLRPCRYKNKYQQWIVDKSDGYIRSVVDKTKCLAPLHRSTHDGTDIVIYNCPSYANDLVFKWKYNRQDGTIRNLSNPHKVFDVTGAYPSKGTVIQLWTNLNTHKYWPAHVWNIVPVPTPTLTIHPTYGPTNVPTVDPTNKPSPLPSKSPTKSPTSKPTNKPSPPPSKSPTSEPTSKPSPSPSTSPSTTPTINTKYYFLQSALSTGNKRWCITWYRKKKSKYGGKIILKPCWQNAKSQKWEVDDHGYIRSTINRHLCLAPKKLETNPGTDIVIYNCPHNFHPAFSWIVKTQDGSIQNAQNKHLVMDVTGGHAKHGAVIQLWYNLNAQQHWPAHIWHLVPAH